MCIDPDCEYPEWLQVLMGIRTETGGSEEGLSLAKDWGGQGKKSKGDAEVESKWKTFRAVERPIRIGTLVRMAQGAEALRGVPAAANPPHAAGQTETPAPAEPAPTHAASHRTINEAPKGGVDRSTLEDAEAEMEKAMERMRRGSLEASVEEQTIRALARIRESSQSAYEVQRMRLRQ